MATAALALSACQVGSIARANDGTAGDGETGSTINQQQSALTEAAEEYLGRHPGLIASISVRHNGETVSFGEQHRYQTASVVKVEIAARWLLLRGDDTLPDDEYQLAERMITASDNEATNQLCELIADQPPAELDSIPGATGACVGKPGWGTDETTAIDQQELVSAVFGSQLLAPASREILTEFMGTVDPAQSWGVSAAANDGEKTWLKNGWDVRDNGWLAHSEGVIDAIDGEPVHIAVLTNGNASEAEGIARVEDLAQIARDAVSG